MNGAVGSVVNIRASLQYYTMSKSFRKILSQNKKRFSHVIRKITPIDHPKERLYQQQKDRFDIFVMDSLQIFLYDHADPAQCIFNTYEVCVYDGDKLVAVSFFDLGIQSVASILGLHDADYQKYSLGTYTLLLEIEFAKEKGFTCFYPGYILLSEKGISFEYKLRLDNLQFRNKQGLWKSIRYLKQEHWIHQSFQQKNELMAQYFTTHQIDYQLLLYPYFAIAKFIYFCQCVEMPSIFGIGEQREQKLLIVEYLLERDSYRVGYVSILNDVFFSMMTENIILSKEIQSSANYMSAPLKYDDILLETPEIEEIIEIIKQHRLYQIN